VAVITNQEDYRQSDDADVVFLVALRDLAMIARLTKTLVKS